MRINVNLRPDQEVSFEELTKLIRQIGEQKGTYIQRVEKNKELYMKIIEIFLAIRLDLMQGNFAQMIKMSLSPNYEFNFFDEDEKVFKHDKIVNIEVIFGKNKPLTEEEIAAMDLQLKSNFLLEEEGNPLRKPLFTVDLGKYDKQLEEEARMRGDIFKPSIKETVEFSG